MRFWLSNLKLGRYLAPEFHARSPTGKIKIKRNEGKGEKMKFMGRQTSGLGDDVRTGVPQSCLVRSAGLVIDVLLLTCLAIPVAMKELFGGGEHGRVAARVTAADLSG
jgi:hypothetical protein